MADIPLPKTPGQKKLHALGVHLPRLVTMAYSDLPKHSELTEIRYKVSKGVQPLVELERKEKISTEVWIRHQERLGLNILVDGEMNRGDMLQFFTRKIGGFEVGGTVRTWGNYYYQKPVIKNKISWRSNLMVDDWRQMQRMTHRPLKAVLTGPYTLMDFSFNDYYTDRETLLADIVPIIKKEVQMLADAGAKIIQIDEPALSAHPEEFSLVSDSIHEIVKGIKSYIILGHSLGSLAPVWDKMQQLKVDNFHLDLAVSRFRDLPTLKKKKTTKDISIGLLDHTSTECETSSQAIKNVKEIQKAIPSDQLWLSIGRGLKTRTIDQATAKLKTLVDTAAKER